MFILSNTSSIGDGGVIGLFLISGGVFCIVVIIILVFLNSRKKNVGIEFENLKWE